MSQLEKDIKTLNYPEYLVVLNQVTNKLIIFEEVFSEYVHTAKDIIKGKALVGESLPLLQKYFSQNLQSLKQFANIIIAIPVESNCLELRENLNNAFQQYILSTKNLYTVINQDNLEDYQAIIECRQAQRSQVLNISKILVSSSKITHDSAI